jgi:hypothetical protein
MEVHAHSHTALDPDSHRGRKKWTHYFWDFFMLFLAVTLGFFVENQREHYIEHQRERLYMRSMTNDLEKDTVMLNNILKRTLSVLTNLDSALIILQYLPIDKKNTETLYRVNLNLLSNTSPAFTDRTTVQLKNSGAMRLIRNEETVGGIVDYWSLAENVKAISEGLDDYRIKARDRSYSIFNQKYYSNGGVGSLKANDEMKLMTNDAFLLTEFANRLSHIKGLALNRYVQAIELQTVKAKKLIETIKEHY